MKSQQDLRSEDQQARLVERSLDLAMSGLVTGAVPAALIRLSLDLQATWVAVRVSVHPPQSTFHFALPERLLQVR